MNKDFKDTASTLQAFSELESNPRLFPQALDASGIPIAVRNSELRPLFANQAFIDFYGYPLNEMRRLPLDQVLPPQTLVLYTDTILPVLQSGKSWEGEYPIRLKTGRICPVRGRFDPVRDENGRLTHIISIMQDASADMRLRTALTQTERHLKFLAENTSDCLFRIRLDDGRYDYVSPAIESISGYTVQELYEDPLLIRTLIQDDWLPTLTQWWTELKSGYSRYEYHWPLLHKDGTRRWINQRITLVEENGEPIAIEGIVTDDTSRKEAEDALHAAQKDYRIMVESITDVVWTQDDAARFTFATPSVEALWGYTPEELYTMDYRELFTEESLQKVSELNRNRRAAEARGEYDTIGRVVLEHVRKDGSKVWAESLLRRLFDDDGRPIGFIGTTRDVTEQRQYEKALEQSEDRFRTLFEESPISLWEEDLTRLKLYFDDLRDQGVEDFRAFFYDNPEALIHCATLVDVVDVNKATLDLLRARSREELLGNLDKVLTESSMAAFTEEMILLASGGCEYCGEITHRTLEGDIIWVVVHFIVPPRYRDTFSRVIVSLLDVTPRKRAEQALMESEERYRVLVENSQEGVVVTKNGAPLYVNDAMMDITGYPAKTVATFNSMDLVHPDDRKDATGQMAAYLNGTSNEGFATFRTMTRHGDTKWVTLTVKPIMWGGEEAQLEILSDVTIHKVLEDELRAAHAEMEDRVNQRTRELSLANERLTREAEERERAQEHIVSLTQQLIRIQEDERKRISRDLHDKVAQDLSSIVLKMETLFDEIDTVDPLVSERSRAITDVVRGTIAAVRGIAYGLRPPALDQIGLVQAIENHCIDVTRQTGLDIDLVSTGIEDKLLNMDTKINVYRMIQEAINNVIKHAGADKVKVRLVKSHPDIIVRIEDNGCGFEVDSRLTDAAGERCMGLRSMEERARIINGSFKLQSLVDTGTRVVFTIPIENARRR